VTTARPAEDVAGPHAARVGQHEAYPVPRILGHAVARPRVTEELLRRIREHSLVQVVAPAGSGKTTAVAQAVEALEWPVAWLTLDEWHRSPGRLLDELSLSLEPIAPGLRGELTGTRTDDAPLRVAAAVGSFLHRREAVLVMDDCHQVKDEPDAVDVIAALIRRGAPGLRVVLVGRAAIPLGGLDLEAASPDATVGDDILRATGDEAAEILRARGSPIEVDEAVQGTGGWIAGLVFETWRTRGAEQQSDDPLRGYLEREVRPRLEPDVAATLIVTSLFDEVDASRLRELGVDDPRSFLATLRAAGLPAVWGLDGQEMRLHPRIREVLLDELRAGSVVSRRPALRAAASAYEAEGNLERALDLYLEAGEDADARRLLPDAILGVVERHDVALADRYLAAVPLDLEPASVTYARVLLASIRASGSEMTSLLDPLVADGSLPALIAEEPRIGADACSWHAAAGRVDDAVELLESMPPGRSADVARLIVSVYRDDPSAPIPPFAGDALDATLARALFGRGLLDELRHGRSAWALATGTHEVGGIGGEPDERDMPRFLQLLAQVGHSIALRDLDAATAASLELIRRRPDWGLLAEAETAIRLAHDPGRAHAAVVRLRELPAPTVFFRELGDTWDGAAALLADQPDEAARVLRQAVASMRRGDRILVLASALVYLAEAEWRLGNEEASDRATDEAYAVARRQGSLRGLLRALADFPGVLSRRLDAELASESHWHSLGRALVVDATGTGPRVTATAVVHLREFGEPALVVDGRRVVRPKIRKSLELLSYLLASTNAVVSREAVLTALWNGRDDDSTRAYLRQALRHLRDVLPAGVSVTATGESLVVEGVVTSESLELAALLAEAARDPGSGRLGYLLEALELTGRGLFLEGSTDVSWIDDRRARIEHIVADVRLDAAELLLGADRHLRALALVDEALDANPLLERGWRLRMRALGLLGDYDGVLSAYAACASALAEIGIEPSRATTELANSLRR
jgi:DNA-binding SARP family transcriptional activator